MENKSQVQRYDISIAIGDDVDNETFKNITHKISDVRIKEGCLKIDVVKKKLRLINASQIEIGKVSRIVKDEFTQLEMVKSEEYGILIKKRVEQSGGVLRGSGKYPWKSKED